MCDERVAAATDETANNVTAWKDTWNFSRATHAGRHFRPAMLKDACLSMEPCKPPTLQASGLVSAAKTPRLRRDELRELMLSAGVQILQEEGLANGGGSLTYADVFRQFEAERASRSRGLKSMAGFGAQSKSSAMTSLRICPCMTQRGKATHFRLLR